MLLSDTLITLFQKVPTTCRHWVYWWFITFKSNYVLLKNADSRAVNFL